jgi:hypothetical protein
MTAVSAATALAPLAPLAFKFVVTARAADLDFGHRSTLVASNTQGKKPAVALGQQSQCR